MQTTITKHELLKRGFRPELAQTLLGMTTPTDVANLPWVGNHWSDMPLFEACSRLVRNKLTERTEQKQTLELMCLHGMGINKPCSDAELDNFLNAEAEYE